MKESTLATKIMIGVLCAGVLLYLALYFIFGFKNELATTVAYSYTVNVGTEANAILVREETVLPKSGTYVDMVLSEGEKAAAGSAVALVYDSLSALDTRQQIRNLEAEIKQEKGNAPEKQKELEKTEKKAAKVENMTLDTLSADLRDMNQT